mmetsp:Transcript_25265/g.35631  ORF Transcript_25265/g.35631 Transcript_25265/m.35631 type:complete len:81 (+) Transcript_25265:93-335(+)
MVASAVFLTDLSGKAIISRNYRGDVPLAKAIERFARYLTEVDDEAKKPVFFCRQQWRPHVDRKHRRVGTRWRNICLRKTQ